MTITLLINQFVFPILLLGVFFTIFNLENLSFSNNSALAESSQSQQDLERFFEAAETDESIFDRLNAISDRAELIEQLIQFGNDLGYAFTASEVISSIEEHTSDPQGNYICLAIGCFSVNS